MNKLIARYLKWRFRKLSENRNYDDHRSVCCVVVMLETGEYQ